MKTLRRRFSVGMSLSRQIGLTKLYGNYGLSATAKHRNLMSKNFVYSKVNSTHFISTGLLAAKDCG
jgi:hypothetical protein